jgi:Ca2+-binding EF-hand superfamily protein
MLNETMLKELFAALDPHKKGYMSESDFSTAFGKYDWKSSMVMEFVETLQTKFGS